MLPNGTHVLSPAHLQIGMDPPDVLYRPVHDIAESEEEDQTVASDSSANSAVLSASDPENSTTELLTTAHSTSSTADWTSFSEEDEYPSTAIQRLLPVILIIIIVLICVIFATWSYLKSQKRSRSRTRYGLVTSSIPSEPGTMESLRTVPSSGIRSGKKSRHQLPVTAVVDR